MKWSEVRDSQTGPSLAPGRCSAHLSHARICHSVTSALRGTPPAPSSPPRITRIEPEDTDAAAQDSCSSIGLQRTTDLLLRNLSVASRRGRHKKTCFDTWGPGLVICRGMQQDCAEQVLEARFDHRKPPAISPGVARRQFVAHWTRTRHMTNKLWQIAPANKVSDSVSPRTGHWVAAR